MTVTLYRLTVISTVRNFQSCVAPTRNRSSTAYTNLVDLRDQVAQAAQEAAAGGLSSFFTLSPPKVLQLAASFTSVLAETFIAMSAATAQIPICGATAEATAGQQLTTIWPDVQSCINQSG